MTPRKKAVLFDFDGVIAQTEYLHINTLLRFMRSLEVEVSKEQLYQFAGTNHAQKVAVMDHEFMTQDAYRLHREEIQDYRGGELPWLEIRTNGIAELMRELKRLGIFTAVVSNSREERLKRVLALYGLLEYVDVITPAADIGPMKPDPFAYRWTMEQLSVLPEECIIVEDSALGIQSGKDAGATVLALRDPDGMIDQRQSDAILTSILQVLEYLDCDLTQ